MDEKKGAATASAAAEVSDASDNNQLIE
jgi:hypothetical protein